MSSWVVGAPIVRHQLAGKPTLSYRLRIGGSIDAMPRALSGARGLLIGVSASVLMWGGLLALMF